MTALKGKPPKRKVGKWYMTKKFTEEELQIWPIDMLKDIQPHH